MAPRRSDIRRYQRGTKLMGIARGLGKNSSLLVKARPQTSQIYADKRESFNKSPRFSHLRTSMTSAAKLLLQFQRTISPGELD
jgi:hypothetical protein